MDIEFQVRIPEEEYPQYVESLFKDFFSNPRNCCKVVEHPRNNELIDEIDRKNFTPNHCQKLFTPKLCKNYMTSKKSSTFIIELVKNLFLDMKKMTR